MLNPRVNSYLPSKPIDSIVSVPEESDHSQTVDPGQDNIDEFPRKRIKLENGYIEADGSFTAPHRSSSFHGSTVWDEELKLSVTQVKSTLVVTPSFLLQQWIDETKRHAPGLSFVVYNGYQAMSRGFIASAAREKESKPKRKRGKDIVQPPSTPANSTATETDDLQTKLNSLLPRPHEPEADFFNRWYHEWNSAIANVDIVFITYEVLGEDLVVALPPKERPRRTSTGPPRAKPRSILLMCEFWRVIMDEVQMLGDPKSATKAAQMVATLKRVNSLALSGTPAKRSIHDLRSSLSFIGVDIQSPLWQTLIQPAYRSVFTDLFRRVAVRHTKAQVAHESGIPGQTRQIVPIKMNVVEKQYYWDLLYRNMDALANAKNGYHNTDLLRQFVQALRSVCTHIQTNEHMAGDTRVDRMRMVEDNRRVLDDMDEALGRMQEQAWRDYYQLVQALVTDRVEYAVALHLDRPELYEKCLTVLKQVDRECERELSKLEQRLESLKENHPEGVIDVDEPLVEAVDADEDEVVDPNATEAQKFKRTARQVIRVSRVEVG